jgi:amino acid transporter
MEVFRQQFRVVIRWYSVPDRSYQPELHLLLALTGQFTWQKNARTLPQLFQRHSCLPYSSDSSLALSSPSQCCIASLTLMLFSQHQLGTFICLDLKEILANNIYSRVPIYEIWHQATRSETAATVFIMVLVGCGFFALIGCQQTASRLTWSFARDDAIVGSHWLGQIHHRHGVPVWSLVANSAVIFVIGCIYLGSTTAFNAMISTGLILQQISYAMPTALLMYRRRSMKYLPSTRSFKLGPFGWVANALTVVMAFIALIFYNFPTVMPVIGSNMSSLSHHVLFDGEALHLLSFFP